MCGIVGFAGRERAVPYLLNCLERLEYRGYDSSGIALSERKGIDVTRQKGRLSFLKNEFMNKKQSDSGCGIGHTRWATHGAPEKKNAHPQLSEKGLFAVVHNGIIENYAELKNGLIEKGVHFSSDTDTEVIAQLLEQSYKGDFLFAVSNTLPLLEGSYALAILCKDYPGKIFCSRCGSPIVLANTPEGNMLSSDVTSLLGYSDEIYKLDDGESALIDEDEIVFFDRAMKPIDKKTERVSFGAADAEKNGFEHFMLKEIYEQPEVVSGLVEGYIKNGSILFPDVHLSDDELRGIDKIMLIGCGSAYHAGLAAKYFTQSLTGICCQAETAGEWRYGGGRADGDTLCIFISQSGETADTLAALRKAKAEGARTLAVVNVVGSSVAAEAESVLYTRAGPEIAVATTKAYTAQLVLLYMLALKIAGLKGSIGADGLKNHLDELGRAGDEIYNILSKLGAKIKKLADEHYTSGQMYFIGRGTDCAAAMEGALKLKEISYIPCHAYAAAELKHGTISLIEKGTPVVALMGNRDLFSKMLNNVREVKARGASVVAFCTREDYDKNGEFADAFIPVPLSRSPLACVYEGVILQLFAYYVSKKRGCDIDKPRNLAKSVTVE